MNRVYLLQLELLKIINSQDTSLVRDETLDWERLHSASCARLGWLLALERGEDPELAASAAAVHDFGRILTGSQNDHAAAGLLPVQAFLRSTGLFNEDEIAVIALAVKNHSSKTVVGSPIEEIVKDADVIDCYQYGMPFDRPEKKTRYEAWLRKHQPEGLPPCC
jgi:uncharacterized protein